MSGNASIRWMTSFVLMGAGVCEACSCMWMGPLLTVGPRSELVIRAKVLRYHGQSRGIDLSMDVEVLEVLKGATPAKTIRIWGDNGMQCRPYVSGFPLHTEWVFAVDRLTDARTTDYEMSVCGEHWARLEDGSVKGRLTSSKTPGAADKPESMSWREFRERVRRP